MRELTSVINDATSHTTLARGLLAAVFTEKALKECSAKGGWANSKKGCEERRRKLYKLGLDTIISKKLLISFFS